MLAPETIADCPTVHMWLACRACCHFRGSMFCNMPHARLYIPPRFLTEATFPGVAMACERLRSCDSLCMFAVAHHASLH
eukprot:350500-Chlamydomonas_euryale.AAC.20